MPQKSAGPAHARRDRESVTFIHAADLHIGAGFKGLRKTTPALARELLRAIPTAYKRLVQTALDRHVDFVVLAGDVFDRAQPSYADFSDFFDGLERLHEAGIPVYVCNGNHDPQNAWNKEYGHLPQNVRLFPADKPGFFTFKRDGRPLAVLGGRSYMNRKVPDDVDMADGITRRDAQAATGVDAPFFVGVLHTGLDLDHTQAPVPREQLLRSGMDYWALGHIHKPMMFDADGRVCDTAPRIVYSGCVQGRDVNDTGPRGCQLVTLEEGKPVSTEFLPLASVVWDMANVDVTGCPTLDAVERAVRGAFVRLPGSDSAGEHEAVVHVALVGVSKIRSLRAQATLDALRDNLNGRHPIVYCDQVVDRTRPDVDERVVREEGLFSSLVLEGAERQRADAEGQADELDRAFSTEGFQLPRSVRRDMPSVCSDAEKLVLGVLGGDAE